MEIRELLASIMANSRAGRHGVPPVKNILDLLPDKLKKDVLDDADDILRELKKNGYQISKT